MKMGNKRLESSHFKVFRTRVPDFPEGEVWHEDVPDFSIHTANQIIGVEHCLIHIQNTERTPLQAIENQIDEIIGCAQEHAELRGMPPIQAQFLFGHYLTLQKAQRVDLARTIARTVHDLVMEMDHSQRFSSTVIRRTEDPRIPAPIVSVHITMLPGDARHFWRCARAGWIVEDCIQLIQDAIDKKGELFQSYLKECQACWFLMVAELKPSSFIHPNQETLDHIFTGPFVRVYFMDMAEKLVHRLKIISG
jgi:hypothetical protein